MQHHMVNIFRGIYGFQTHLVQHLSVMYEQCKRLCSVCLCSEKKILHHISRVGSSTATPPPTNTVVKCHFGVHGAKMTNHTAHQFMQHSVQKWDNFKDYTCVSELKSYRCCRPTFIRIRNKSATRCTWKRFLRPFLLGLGVESSNWFYSPSGIGGWVGWARFNVPLDTV